MDEYEIRPFTMQEYPAAIRLWQATEGIGLSPADAEDRIRAYLKRNPGASFTAWVEGKMVGAVLSGHDGRRGYIHHLAVAVDFRLMGIGKALTQACLTALAREGIDKVHIFVYADNEKGFDFWRKQGWVLRKDLLLMSRDLPED